MRFCVNYWQIPITVAQRFFFLFKNPPVLTPPDCEMHSFANVYNLLPIVFLGFLNYLFAHFFGEILDNVGSMGLYLQGLDYFIF